MRVWQIPSFGVESLEFIEHPTLAPGPGEVLVRVRAVSFNYRDLLVVKGSYNPRMKLPRIPCSDGAGEVVAVGDNVTSYKTGDRVAAIFMQNWLEGPIDRTKSKGALGGDVDGMLAEYVVLKESGLVRIPEHLSFQEAATLPCAAVTAWNALRVAKLPPGATVLIQGTGGVSIFVLQLARLSGARVLGISSSDAKLERAFSLGLDGGVNYIDNPEWDRWVLNQTDGAGVDLVVEVGGLKTLPQSLKAVRMGGTVAQVGVLSGSDDPVPFPLTSIIHKWVNVQGVYVGSRKDFEDLNRAISLVGLRPVGENFHWSQAREVLLRMEEGGHFGKLVVTIE